jgi:Na+/phosphate symporter
LHTGCMQKMLVAAAAFVIGATLGMGLLAAVVIVAAVMSARRSGGLGVLTGGVGHSTVLVVPVACGLLAAWMALRRLNQVQR